MDAADILKSLLSGNPPVEGALGAIRDSVRWLHIEAVASPSVAQLEALRTFEPFSGENLIQTRKALVAGTRVGPFPESQARSLAESILSPAELLWSLTVPTEEELREQGLIDE